MRNRKDKPLYQIYKSSHKGKRYLRDIQKGSLKLITIESNEIIVFLVSNYLSLCNKLILLRFDVNK